MKKKGLLTMIVALCLLIAGCGKSYPEGENALSDNSAPASLQTDTQTAGTPVSESGSDDRNQSDHNMTSLRRREKDIRR